MTFKSSVSRWRSVVAVSVGLFSLAGRADCGSISVASRAPVIGESGSQFAGLQWAVSWTVDSIYSNIAIDIYNIQTQSEDMTLQLSLFMLPDLGAFPGSVTLPSSASWETAFIASGDPQSIRWDSDSDPNLTSLRLVPGQQYFLALSACSNHESCGTGYNGDGVWLDGAPLGSTNLGPVYMGTNGSTMDQVTAYAGGAFNVTGDLEIPAIPEPATAVFVGAGLLFAGILLRRRR